jgi:hypothetical protein
MASRRQPDNRLSILLGRVAGTAIIHRKETICQLSPRIGSAKGPNARADLPPAPHFALNVQYLQGHARKQRGPKQ